MQHAPALMPARLLTVAVLVAACTSESTGSDTSTTDASASSGPPTSSTSTAESGEAGEGGEAGESSDTGMPEQGTIQVYATHHPAPADGGFPAEQVPTRFDTDLGWEVTLELGVMTTSGMTLHACSNSDSLPLVMPWGDFPDDLAAPDLENFPLGSFAAQPDQWCGLTVQYGPLDPPEDEDYAAPHPDAVGATVLLRGTATKGDQSVPIDLSFDDPVDVLLVLSNRQDGGPLTAEGFSAGLLVSKSYDRIFDGVEFDLVSAEDLGQAVAENLGKYSYVTHGTVIEL